MEYHDPLYCLEVWGDYACFTRPELKVERVSYDVITPSAARMIFQAVFWKPAIRWQVERIDVLSPIRWVSVRRNETAKLCSPSGKSFFIEDTRQQKAGLFLRDVKYRLFARQIYLPPDKRPKLSRAAYEDYADAEEKTERGKDENPGKYHAMFERRAKKGQCLFQPYLGCREFSCHCKFVTEPYGAHSGETRELGLMLYDMDYSDEADIKPMFFRARLENGTINVPAPESGEIFR
ncbi:type I-C CRISPR-associated protein Cas5c [Cloacibacillus sp. An23]|uniref:type I-C CRISPR-associated protein Cas5c n=1 Tax=Cloacibacillus sp. An23 TaxID=1965591 RepID=UPI000B371ABC|nr:type I-C CRISPR-associated protein Cas5c [Cloacibacillus sp. An23]OUO94102.1 type I-C CRISPR-associated protein Cas5 [Cloacibacillus sp. An23]